MNEHEEHSLLLRLSFLPALGAAVASLLWWHPANVLWAAGIGTIAYCLTATLRLGDLLWLIFSRNQAERARHRAVQASYQLFLRSITGEPAGELAHLPGTVERRMVINDRGSSRQVTWFVPQDPQEKAVRERLVTVCFWAWALQNPAEHVSGLESEVMVGEGLAFKRPNAWVEATGALRDIGVVSKPGVGRKTEWAPNWNARKAIAYIESGVPLPLVYDNLHVNVQPRPERPTPPAPTASSRAGGVEP